MSKDKDTDIGIANFVVVLILTGVSLMTPARTPGPTEKIIPKRKKRELPTQNPASKTSRLHLRRAYAARGGRRGRNLEGV